MSPYRITVHCSATQNGVSLSIDTIAKWHKERGFLDVGYHVVIDVDGTIEYGRAFKAIGAHVKHANKGNLGICLVGNTKFKEAQFESLRYILDELSFVYDIDPWNITCHYEYPSARDQGKSCPNIPISHLLVWYLDGNPEAIRSYLL